MRLIASSLACAGLAAASSFQDTSPFIFFSTSEVLASPPQLTTSSSLSSTLTSALSRCLTDVYFIAHQPGVSASDYSSEHHCSDCLQTKYLSGKHSAVRSSFSVAQVLGAISPSSLGHTLESECGASATSLDASTGMVIGSTDNANVTKPRVVHVELPALPSDGAVRKSAQQEHERMLDDMIEMHGGKSYTVLYTTTPREVEQHAQDEEVALEYEMDNSQVPLNMELKRDLGSVQGARVGHMNASDPKAPLFEKYQYFTPALFSGLGIFLLLSAILYVAISAIAGLQVSYAAFDKESGPQAQKKQQ